MANERKPVVITGGTKGIGRAISEHLAALGYDLVISYSSDEEAANETTQAVQFAGGNALVLRADARNKQSVEELFAKGIERFGAPYAVIANAGIENVEAPFAEMSSDDLDKVVDTNFKGTFIALQQAARSVVDGGRVIATASQIAVLPPPRSGAYAATKAAVRSMIDVLTLELGPRGIAVNSLNPGPVDGAGIFTRITDEQRDHFVKLTPMGRLPQPQDLVGAVEFLLSDGARLISGHHLAVTGGFR
ncbi:MULTISPECIES: SDR family NAD(P)-dependent oxidoreductase [Rhizobium]|uniref:SDR family NAD(P)-dependent oxidoreductase n=1 Tax=Rhizobium TaxID=379 RepID=UPI001C83133A|nr:MULTISPECIES: SDR family NAD(P)-dependent oxidoreductase [Rhizobium]MBX4899689.1 SDR family oxidoreductase [Rhizobium bangladeshense]MBX5297606.1 SDR family oxidoreductase [Rhizobium sp. NLR15a]MBY3617851.1 SDR family oxidoreductase [Rhizobium bangladeshense]